VIAALSLLIWTCTVYADEGWVVWRRNYVVRDYFGDPYFGVTWEPLRRWATARECDSDLPHYRIDGVTLLVDNHVPGWCCLPDTHRRKYAAIWARSSALRQE